MVYYTFDNARLAVSDGFASIRNDAGPAAALAVQSYMHTMPALVPGMAGYGEALTFPQGRERVQADGGLKLTDYTVAFWFKAPKGAGTIGICSSGPEFFLKDGAMVANHHGWYSHQPAGANLDDDQWHHVAFGWIMAERRQRLYVDGVLVATNHGPQGGGHSGAASLGRANTGGALLGGCLDEFRLYARCLSADEVRTLARGTSAPH